MNYRIQELDSRNKPGTLENTGITVLRCQIQGKKEPESIDKLQNLGARFKK